MSLASIQSSLTSIESSITALQAGGGTLPTGAISASDATALDTRIAADATALAALVPVAPTPATLPAS